MEVEGEEGAVLTPAFCPGEGAEERHRQARGWRRLKDEEDEEGGGRSASSPWDDHAQPASFSTLTAPRCFHLREEKNFPSR